VIVVDSSVWIAAFRGATSAGARKLAAIANDAVDEILVGDLILLEVLQGARDDRQANFIERRLRAFPIEAMLDADLATSAARNFRFLRERGVTLAKIAALIIATFCIERRHALLHEDRDFEAAARHLPLRVI
jgi:predicted nucleic acid-binding protein